MTVVIGIDAGTASMHAAIVHTEDDALVLARVLARTDKYQLPTAVLATLFRRTRGVLDETAEHWPGDEPVVFIEEPLVAGARNIRSGLKLAEAVGVIIAAVSCYTDRCYLVPVASWKKGTVGNGSASKQDVALWLSQYHPSYAAHCDGSQDLADACCIARYGVGVVADSALVRTIGSAVEL